MMVFFIFNNGECAINLFGQYESSQLMRESELGERPFEICFI